MANTPYPFPRETRQTDVLVGTDVASYGPFGFKIFDVEDVTVLWKQDGEDVFSEKAVTVTKTNGDPFDTFSIDFGENVPATTKFVVQAARTHTRQVAVTKGGAVSTVELEKELSKQGIVIEELRRDVDARVAFQPDHDGDTRLPAAENARALVWDENGALANGPTTDEIENAQTYANNAKASADASASSASTSTTQAGISTTKAGEASASATLAQKWANEDEDTEVSGGAYSAYHWAQKAQEFASGSAAAISFTPTGDLEATDVQTALEELDAEKAPAGHTHAHFTNTANPHSVTKAQVGLGNVTDHAQVKAADKALQGEAEAGTDDTKWMTPLKTKQAIDALAASEGLGVGQTWQDVTGSRSAGTSYQNTTGKPIACALQVNAQPLQVSVDNSVWVDVIPRPGNYNSFFIVPDNHYYRLVSGGTIKEWVELR